MAWGVAEEEDREVAMVMEAVETVAAAASLVAAMEVARGAAATEGVWPALVVEEDAAGVEKEKLEFDMHMQQAHQQRIAGSQTGG